MATNNDFLSDAGGPTAETISAPPSAFVTEQGVFDTGSAAAPCETEALRDRARQAVSKWKPCPSSETSNILRGKWKAANRSIRQACRERINAGRDKPDTDIKWLGDASSSLSNTCGS